MEGLELLDDLFAELVFLLLLVVLVDALVVVDHHKLAVVGEDRLDLRQSENGEGAFVLDAGEDLVRGSGFNVGVVLDLDGGFFLGLFGVTSAVGSADKRVVHDDIGGIDVIL